MAIEKVREGQDASLTVEGSLTTERVNFRDIPYSAEGAGGNEDDQFVYFATAAGEQNQTVRIGRSYDDEGERKETDFFIVQTGTTGDIAGDSNITVAGEKSTFRLRAAYGNKAILQLMEDSQWVTDPLTGAQTQVPEDGVSSAFTLENRGGALAGSGTRGYAIFRMEDYRPADQEGEPWFSTTAFSEYENMFPVSFNVTDYGGAELNIKALDSRGVARQANDALFVPHQVRAMFKLSSSPDTEFSFSAEAAANYDKIVIRNGTEALMNFTYDNVTITPGCKHGEGGTPAANSEACGVIAWKK